MVFGSNNPIILMNQRILVNLMPECSSIVCAEQLENKPEIKLPTTYDKDYE